MRSKLRPSTLVPLLAFAIALHAGFSMVPSQAVSAAAPRPTGSSAPKNLLVNPGFEKPLADHPWMPARWDTFPSGLPTVFFGRDTFLVHSGRYAVNVANLSTYVPMFHNWSQSLTVGRELWGKDAVFTVWSRSNGLQGRAYVLLQAYRDTVGKMSRTWGVTRDVALQRLGILRHDDPLTSLGWDREYFSENETEWVKREVRVFIPPSTNTLIVRCGIFGTGQVLFDDASLTTAAPRKWPELPLSTNLLDDPGFEGDGNSWEYSMPPFEGLRIERDTTVVHSGKASIHMTGGVEGPLPVRTGVCKVLVNPHLSGKRVRMSAWIRTDSLMTEAYIKVYCTTIEGEVSDPAPAVFAGTKEWAQTSTDIDVPPGTLMLWGWFTYNAPGQGHLYIDDCSLEVLGPANYVVNKTPPPRAIPR